MEYDVSAWIDSVITIEARGKAPKKYGEGVFKFWAPLTLGVILPRRGWSLAKSTKQYAYLKPPENTSPPYTIQIKTPTHEQVIDIAKKCYENKESWMGQLGEWPAWYTHERKVIVNELVPSEDRTSVTEKFSSELLPQTCLSIGEFGVWSIKVSKTTDGFEVHESGLIEQNETGKILRNSLIEGKEQTYERTRYERNPQARQECIAHNGCSCRVCDMGFGEFYGDIGEGFIHVHHIIPISQQEGEYEIDPINDLVPLCPNCHSMIHRSNPPLSIEQLKEAINKKREKKF